MISNTILYVKSSLGQDAMSTDAEELTKAWRGRARVLFDAAKKMTGGMFNEDKAFAMQLKELKKQYDEIIN